MRKGFRQLPLGVGVALLAALCVGGVVFAVARPAIRGGTVLTYEVMGEGVSDAGRQELVGRLQQRLDPDGKEHLIVREAGANRVEVIVPVFDQADATDQVEFARHLVRQTGLLEFRILANPQDDREGIEATEKLLELPSQQDRDDLNKAAREGFPPLATTGRFRVKAAGDEQLVGYRWVELGVEERESLGLSERYEGAGKTIGGYTNRLFDEVAATRGKTFLQQQRQGNGALLFSRDHEAGTPGQKVDYFYLTRESPTDSLAVAEDVRITATVSVDQARGPAVAFEFVSGAERFTELTRRNRPSGDLERQLAIVLDGKVVAAPTLKDRLNGRGVISGNFDSKSAAQLSAILNSGPLNVALKPDPVNETPLDEAATTAIRASANGRAGLLGLIAGLPVFVVVLAAWVAVKWLSGRRAGNR